MPSESEQGDEALSYWSAAGNRFALIDARCGPAPVEPETLARELAVAGGWDGLLVCGPPRARGDVAMAVFNADGSRPEACGNGLRCVAAFAVARGLAADELVIETDAGPCAARVLRDGEDVVAVRTVLGAPRLIAAQAPLGLDEAGVPRGGALVDVGNPHCVLFVEDVERAPVAPVGSALQRHPRFPRGVNVGFATLGPGSLVLRVFERGVGETLACGTGAVAAAFAAARTRGRTLPLCVRARGGELLVEPDEGGALALTGPVERLSVAQRVARA